MKVATRLAPGALIASAGCPIHRLLAMGGEWIYRHK